MAGVKFVRQFDKSREMALSPGGGPQVTPVDQVYESVEHLVGRMVAAGERLEAARARGFDFADGVDTGGMDVTRTPGFDLADVTREAVSVEARLSAQKEASDAAAVKAAAEKAAQDLEALRAKVRAEVLAEQAGRAS